MSVHPRASSAPANVARMFWRRRPDPLAELGREAGTLFYARSVRIRASAKDLRIPGHNRVSTAVRLHRGSAVVSADHLTVTYRRFVAIDAALSDDPSLPTQVSFDATGIHVSIDLTAALRAVPGKNSGTAEIFVQAPIPTQILALLAPRAIDLGAAQISAISRRI
jgi:hypothetical protein